MGEGNKSGMEWRMIRSGENGMNEWMDGRMDGDTMAHESQTMPETRKKEKGRWMGWNGMGRGYDRDRK